MGSVYSHITGEAEHVVEYKHLSTLECENIKHIYVYENYLYMCGDGIFAYAPLEDPKSTIRVFANRENCDIDRICGFRGNIYLGLATGGVLEYSKKSGRITKVFDTVFAITKLLVTHPDSEYMFISKNGNGNINHLYKNKIYVCINLHTFLKLGVNHPIVVSDMCGHAKSLFIAVTYPKRSLLVFDQLFELKLNFEISDFSIEPISLIAHENYIFVNSANKTLQYEIDKLFDTGMECAFALNGNIAFIQSNHLISGFKNQNTLTKNISFECVDMENDQKKLVRFCASENVHFDSYITEIVPVLSKYLFVVDGNIHVFSTNEFQLIKD